MSRTAHTRTKSRCVDCGKRSSGLFVRCPACIDALSATLDGRSAGWYTALLLGDVKDVSQPLPGSYAHAQARFALRRARFGAES